MNKCNFYYDETEHSRKINKKTVLASNYYDNFVTAIVGWNEDLEEKFKIKYKEFEDKYSDRKNKSGELKSTSISQKQFEYGFASFNSYNLDFVSNFLDIYDENIYFCFCVSSKIEYIVLQLFAKDDGYPLYNTHAMKYIITKALIEYQPQEVIEAIYDSPKEFVRQLKEFFGVRIEIDKKNIRLKEKEIKAFEQVIMVLDKISTIPNFEWKYWMPFNGFVKYLKEKGIDEYSLLIDKEGIENQDSDTLIAAREVGIEKVMEGDSKKYFGLRMADMLVGIIAKLLKALRKAMKYSTPEEEITKKILDSNWFCMNDFQLNLYKQLYKIICVWDSAWYKSYSGIYSDDLICLIALLGYINKFDSAEQMKQNLDMHGEYFNSYVCTLLENHFSDMQYTCFNEVVLQNSKEYAFNQQGAKVFLNPSKQPILSLPEGKTKCKVLSVGINYKLEPIATILKDDNPVCYRIPVELYDWVIKILELSNIGVQIFPEYVVFTRSNEKYFADIL